MHYPPGYPYGVYPDVPGDVPEFREERRLVTPDTLELTVWFRIEGKWQRWADAGAKPFVMTRQR